MNICGFVERYAQKAVDVRKAVSVSGRQDKQQILWTDLNSAEGVLGHLADGFRIPTGFDLFYKMILIQSNLYISIAFGAGRCDTTKQVMRF